MGNDIIIGKAKVTAVEEVSLDAKQTAPWSGAVSGAALTSAAMNARNTMVVSRLKIEPAGKTEGYTSIEGIMMIPSQLPFGKTYELTLHDPGSVLDGNDRKFKEGE